MNDKNDTSVETSNNKVVKICDNEIVKLLKNTPNKDDRRKIITSYLIKIMEGNIIFKEQFCIKNTKRDTIHLAHNEHLDTSIALTQIYSLIKNSIYFSEQKVDSIKKPNSPNDYYWYFKSDVEIDGVLHSYVLNIGRNKTDKHICVYAITNYNEINELSKRFLEEFQDVKIERNNYFEKDIYPTPNISVRTVILNKNKDKVMMVREVALGTYSLPGGWADLYDSPSKTAKNECSQEAGADIEVVRLVGILDRTPFKSSASIPEYVVVFEGRVIGNLHEHEYETDDVGWFDIDNLPPISRKTSKEELLRMILAAKDGKTIFD